MHGIYLIVGALLEKNSSLTPDFRTKKTASGVNKHFIFIFPQARPHPQR